MARKISLSDITIKQSALEGGHPLSFREKIELSKILDKLGADVIELSPILGGKADSLLVKSVASAVTNAVVAVPVDITSADGIRKTWAALEEAAHPRLQVSLPVSTVQMEYILHKKPALVLELIRDQVTRCRELCQDVEFIAEDSSRSETEFLLEAIREAVAAGAGTVTLCDTAGTMLPDEFMRSIESIRGILESDTRLGVKCSNDMFLADACAVSALRGGADEIKVVSAGGVTASLESVARILDKKSDLCGASTGIRLTELNRLISQIRWMCETDHRESSPLDNAVSQGGVDLQLGEHDDMEAVIKAARNLGYDLSEEDCCKVYDSFLKLVSGGGTVSARELDAIVASAAFQVPATYLLESYVINTGNAITATCHMRLSRDGSVQESVCLGDGPVDAAFQAIEKVVGRHYELDDFQIRAVTEGREAMGETVVRLRAGGKVFSGRGISKDIVGSSIMAYLSAVNKIVYEEGEA